MRITDLRVLQIRRWHDLRLLQKKSTCLKWVSNRFGIGSFSNGRKGFDMLTFNQVVRGSNPRTLSCGLVRKASKYRGFPHYLN